MLRLYGSSDGYLFPQLYGIRHYFFALEVTPAHRQTGRYTRIQLGSWVFLPQSQDVYTQMSWYKYWRALQHTKFTVQDMWITNS